VSTCYVCGTRQGRIDEALHPDTAPSGEAFPAEAEYLDALAAVESVQRAQDSTGVRDQLQYELEALKEKRRNSREEEAFARRFSRRWLREYLRKEMVAAGKARARRWGWQNTYTYSKSLTEALLARRSRNLRYATVRPSIIESSLSFPFPGWNQGYNASAPLAFLLGTWFHMLPAKSDCPFDVVPVDMVCRALTLIGAALMRGEHQPVYHVGTSDRNCFTVGRACELTDLGHRRHLRGKGDTTLKRVLLSRWDVKVVDADHLFSVRNIRRAVSEFGELLDDSPRIIRKRTGRLSSRLARAEKQLREIEDVLDMFRPFVHDNFQVFECRALDRHSPLEPEFRFAPEIIDWRKYWIEIHMPGLRRWIFPRFEGKRSEAYTAEHPVKLEEPGTKVSSINVTSVRPAPDSREVLP
jgi:long-chain acyl-CoA synthetase